MTVLIARDAGSLERIGARIHDWWFHADLVRNDLEGQVVEIPVAEGERRKKWLIPFEQPPASYDSLLTIRNVVELRVDDSDQIGAYCISDLVFDDSLGEIWIVGVPDCVLRCVVDALEVQCDLSPQAEARFPTA